MTEPEAREIFEKYEALLQAARYVAGRLTPRLSIPPLDAQFSIVVDGETVAFIVRWPDLDYGDARLRQASVRFPVRLLSDDESLEAAVADARRAARRKHAEDTYWREEALSAS
jgi:hypothetical protein